MYVLKMIIYLKYHNKSKDIVIKSFFNYILYLVHSLLLDVSFRFFSVSILHKEDE
jgi:hypothetical protein